MRSSKRIISLAVVLATACGSSDSTSATNNVTQSKDKLYLTLAATGSTKVAVIDPSTDTKIGEVGVGGEPHDAICTPNGERVYVSNPVTNNVSVIDTNKDEVVATIDMGAGSTPWHIEVSPDGKMIFVALQGAKEIAIIDTATNTVSKRVATATAGDERAPWALSAPANDKVYATLNGVIARTTANSGKEIVYIDPTAATPSLAYITVGDGPHGLLAAPDKSAMYVATQKSHEVWKVTVATNAASKFADISVASPPPLNPGFPTDVAVAPSGDTIVSGNHDADSISFITGAGTVSTVGTGAGSQPWGATVNPAGTKVYVSTSGLDTISVFDLATKTETKKITVGKGPDGFTWCRK